jgi:DNA-binding MarR family transcriptional regulator
MPEQANAAQIDPLDHLKCSEIGKACVCSNLRKASRLITQTYDEFLRPAGLRGTQFALLMSVKGFGSTTVKTLAGWTIMDRTTVARNLKLLEKKGHIMIKPGKDLRERVVTITHEGSDTLIAALPLWEKAQDHIDEIFGKQRTRHVVAELSNMVSTMRKKKLVTDYGRHR